MWWVTRGCCGSGRPGSKQGLAGGRGMPVASALAVALAVECVSGREPRCCSSENLYDKSPRGKLQDNLRCYSLVSWGGGLSRSDFRGLSGGLVLVRSSASRSIVAAVRLSHADACVCALRPPVRVLCGLRIGMTYLVASCSVFAASHLSIACTYLRPSVPCNSRLGV